MEGSLNFVDVQKVIYDSSLIMAIIAINMTIIGLTSLAEFKKVIGIDYGSFLIKKYRLFLGIKIYHLLIVFAIINVSSLFFMFIDTQTFRLFNFILLVFSLIFAIYYFFSFIIVENKAVRKQIYQAELEGLYIKSDNTNHQEADILTEMSSGSSQPKKISSNLIEFFNTYNYDTQSAFEEIFGPNSLLYNLSSRRKKRYKRKYKAEPYCYRKKNIGTADISYEFFQFFRSSDLQDKWAIEILRLLDGEKQELHKFDELRLYNFARLLTQINLFVRSGNIYKYKFLEHLKKYYEHATNVGNLVELLEINKVREIEEYTYRQLLKFLFIDIGNKDKLFSRYAKQWVVELIQNQTYKGLLTKYEMILIFLEVSMEISNEEIEQAFAETLSIYYSELDESEIPDDLKLQSIKNKIEMNRQARAMEFNISRDELFV